MAFLDRSASVPHALCNRDSTARRVLLCALALSVGMATGCDRGNAVRGFAEESRAVGKSADPEVQGFSCRTFPDEVGNPRGYVVFVPNSYRSGCKPPILLFLNGFGENGEDGNSIGNNFGLQIWEMQEFFPFLAIAPQCRTDGNWITGSPDVTWALQVLDAVIEEFNADEDRVYLTGISSGGSGVWSVGSAYSKRFAALVPQCGSAGGDADHLVNARLPIWNFYNDHDSVGLVMSNRSIRVQLINLGLSPLVSEFHADGHDCWNRAYRTMAMYGWLLEQRRSQNATEPLFDYLPSERLLTEWNRHGPGEWTIEENGILVGRNPRDRVEDQPGLLVSNTTSRSVEIHGDMWLQPDSVCRIALLNGEPSEPTEGLWLSLTLPDIGTGGVANSNGEWLARLDPAAQRALQSNSWNDVRVRLAEGRLTVRLNGWSAIDLTIESEGAAVEYHCALVVPDDDSDVRWRLIRTRVP